MFALFAQLGTTFQAFQYLEEYRARPVSPLEQQFFSENLEAPSCSMMQIFSLRRLHHVAGHQRQWALPAHILAGRRFGGHRYIAVQVTPSTDSQKIVVGSKSDSVSSPDASFEILGSPYSLLSVTLSPSQDLYTRRGTLVGVSGSPDTAVSTLRLLSPLRRVLIGIPFLYQKITSTTPINALITTKSPVTSLAILQLDGTTDWKLAQRKALLAWTGKTLSITPSINSKMSVAYWGSSDVTGRGLMALAGQGQVFSVELADGESYVAHPSNILAYSISGPSTLPQPYRFKSSTLTFQIPLQLGNFFPSSKFVQNMKASDTYKFFSNLFLRMRTWSRRTIWGDRLFLQFTGPTTILLQSRAARVSDVLTARDVNEIADAPAGVVQEAITGVLSRESDASRTGVEGATPSASPSASEKTTASKPPRLSLASVSRDGKVTFEGTKNFEQVQK